MLQIKSSRFGGEYGEKRCLFPREQIERTSRVGLITTDSIAKSRKQHGFDHKAINFPEINSRIVKNVSICNGYIMHDSEAVYTDNSVLSLSARDAAGLERIAAKWSAEVKASSTIQKQEVAISEPLIFVGNEGQGTWGHWVIHNFPKIAVASVAYPDFKIAIPAAYTGSRSNFGELLQLYGIVEDRLVRLKSDTNYILKSAVIIDFLYHDRSVHPFCIKIFDDLLARISVPPAKEADHVLIQRTTDGKRELTNRQAFEARMTSSQTNFKALKLGKCSLIEQIETWMYGSEFCSVLGSDFTNIVFGRTGSSILAITPAWFHDGFFFDLAAARGMVWNELFCGQMDQERTPLHMSHFSVELSALERFLGGYTRAQVSS